MFPYVPQHQIITSTESPRCCYYAAQRSLAAPGPRGFIGGRCEVGGNWGITANSSELLRVIEGKTWAHVFLVIVVLMLFSLFMNKVQCRTGGMADVGGQTNWNTQRGQMNCGVGQTFKCWDLLRKQLLFRTWFHSSSDPLLHAFTVYQVMYTLYWVCQCPPRCLAPMATWIYNSPQSDLARQLEAMCFKCRLFRYHLVPKWAFQSLGLRMNVWCVCVHFRAQMTIINNCSMLLFTRYASGWCIPMRNLWILVSK